MSSQVFFLPVHLLHFFFDEMLLSYQNPLYYFLALQLELLLVLVDDCVYCRYASMIRDFVRHDRARDSQSIIKEKKKKRNEMKKEQNESRHD